MKTILIYSEFELLMAALFDAMTNQLLDDSSRTPLFIVVAGVVVGLLMAFASGRLIASLLFANSGAETSIYVAIALLLIAIAMLACFIPAYKATKVDPNEALRHE
jgi:ABC-type antimicrobial peptide transport system permease subunit